MGTMTMGKVLVSAKIENLADLHLVEQGVWKEDAIRKVEVNDALVDTGASTISLPRRLVAQLGLKPGRIRQARTTAGVIALQMFGAVRLSIQGRDCICDVLEISDDLPVIIGQIPLELMDWVVDPVHQRLIGNPEHGGEQVIELY